MSQKTKSRTSPVGGKKGCLCDDNTYSKECCKGELSQQAIGQTSGVDSVTVTEANGVRVITRVNG